MKTLDLETQLRLLNLERAVLLEKLSKNINDSDTTYGNPELDRAIGYAERLLENTKQIRNLVN